MMNCKSAKLTTKIPTILFYEIINTTNINKKNNTITFISYIPTLLHKHVGYGKLKITSHTANSESAYF